VANNSNDSLPLLKGTLDLIVLKVLSWGAQHGYGIASWLEQHTDGEMGIDDSALYQALHRLEGRRFVKAEWGVTENNRRARYYNLTREGRRHLGAEAETWLRYTKSVTAILALTGPG
jgi:PadR family transcriptional regulator